MKVGSTNVNANWKVSSNPYVSLSTNVAVGRIPVPIHILNRRLSLNLTLSNVMVEEDPTSNVEDEWDGVFMVGGRRNLMVSKYLIRLSKDLLQRFQDFMPPFILSKLPLLFLILPSRFIKVIPPRVVFSLMFVGI